ncbi:MAG: hypothetical protein M3Q45_13985 [Chloroflexota bacterium]|nr:hypothetical protein [Chloroflexota bacterium]
MGRNANRNVTQTTDNKSILVFLDEDDPRFNEADLHLAHTSPLPIGIERVYIRMKKQVRIVEQVEWSAEIMPVPVV